MRLEYQILILLTYSSCSVCGSALAQEPKHRPLQVEESIDTWSFLPGTPISLSPDGQWVAYAIRREQKLAVPAELRYSTLTPTGVRRDLVGSDIWIASTQTGESRNLSNGEVSNWAPVWSPNGRYLAFASDRGGRARLWLWDKLTGKLRSASSETVNVGILPGPARPYQWTPDSKHLVVGVLPKGMDLEDLLDCAYGKRQQSTSQDRQSGATVEIAESRVIPNGPEKQHDAGDVKYSCLSLSELALIDIDGGRAHRISEKFNISSLVISPDGAYVAVMSYSGQAAVNSQQELFELFLVSLTTGESKAVDRKLRWDYKPLTWSPSSNLVVCETHGPGEENSLLLLSLSGEGSRRVSLPTDVAILDLLKPSAAPWLWDRSGQALYSIARRGFLKVTAPSGEVAKIVVTPELSLLSLIPARDNIHLWSSDANASAIVLARDNKTFQEGFYRANLVTGELKKLFEAPKTFSTGLGFMDVSENQGALAYLAEDVQHPQDIWMMGSDMQNLRQVTTINARLAQYEFGKSQIIKWRSLDGQNLNGALLLPARYEEGKRYPLIVYVYGGFPLSTALNEWSGPTVFNMQLFATRGYAVLLPDSPLNVGTPVQDLAKTVLPGVQKVVELGIADPDRVGIMGHSYGGYSTLALVVQSRVFKAAVAISGITNLLNAYLKSGPGGDGIGWVEEGQGRMGGSAWQYPGRFIENSPFFYLDRVQAPVLLIHGESDQTDPIAESRIAFESLRRLRKEAVLATYKGEGHRPSQWSYANQIDFCNRVIAWFDKYLKPAQPPN